MTSTSPARPPSKLSRRTRLPTDTASSTSAVSRCGVDTDTSTPHISLNIHSFFGLLTRATTRGTRELLLGEQRDHEVVLVVAGDGGDDVGLVRRRPARTRVTSHPSATSHGTPGGSLMLSA